MVIGASETAPSKVESRVLAVSDPVDATDVKDSVCETLAVTGETADVLTVVCIVLWTVAVSLAAPEGDASADVVEADAPCPGSKTSGTVALEDVNAASGRSTSLKVAVSRAPEDVSVTVSKLTEVTRLGSGPTESILFTNGSISKPGLIANIMPSSQ